MSHTSEDKAVAGAVKSRPTQHEVLHASAEGVGEGDAGQQQGDGGCNVTQSTRDRLERRLAAAGPLRAMFFEAESAAAAHKAAREERARQRAEAPPGPLDLLRRGEAAALAEADELPAGGGCAGSGEAALSTTAAAAARRRTPRSSRRGAAGSGGTGGAGSSGGSQRVSMAALVRGKAAERAAARARAAAPVRRASRAGEARSHYVADHKTGERQLVSDDGVRLSGAAGYLPVSTPAAAVPVAPVERRGNGQERAPKRRRRHYATPSDAAVP